MICRYLCMEIWDFILENLMLLLPTICIENNSMAVKGNVYKRATGPVNPVNFNTCTCK